ncbi:MAG: T9SS type B sorting domain-containing protein, partial [Bacteroidia bacterium]
GVNDPEANEWFISGAECGNAAGVCGSVCGATDPSLHIGANDGFVLDAGASYDAGGFCGVLFCVATDMRAESPTINCFGKVNITMTFNYMENGDLTTDDATLWYFDGTVWAQIDPLAKTPLGACAPQGKWTAFSILLPASANNNPNVKIGFRWVNNDDGVGTDPSFAVDDINLSTPTTNTITTGVIAGSPFCACSTVNVPFTSTGTFTAGNIYTAQLSNAAGSFAAPVAIGTLASTASSGTIACTIPCGTPTGSGYRIRVISSAPPVTGTDNGVNLTINAPAVATFSYTGTPYCQSAANPSPTFSGGGVAGTFSSTAGLVFVSAATGQVNLSASTAGTYTVTNTIAATGGCPAVTATSTIVINPLQNAAFNYSGSTFCQSGPNPTPTITGVAGGTFSSTAGLVFVSTSTGQINLSASTLGTYTITYTTPGPCPGTATASVTITTAPVATFSYTGTPYCQNAANPSPTFSGGGSAGTFSSTAGLVFVSTVTGQVNLSASTAGTYTVTNTIAASGGCPATSATSSITINPVQDSSFSYSASTFCQSGPNPTPTITGTPGGTFSSTAGLVFVSTSTGQINLSASTLGTYTITYTTPGPCATSGTASITITTTPVATFSYTGTPYCQNAPNPSPTYSGGGSAGTFSSTAGLVFVSTSTGQVNLLASTPGTYTVTNTIAASGGCPTTSATSSITINLVQDSSFSYTGSTFCQSGTNPVPTTATPGGTFSASPAGLVFVSTSTGEINLAGSALGTYTITYTTPGPCATSANATITITTVPVATFSYSATSYCQNDPNPSPTFSGGGSAGTFTSTAGLSINAATGVINLAASTAGTYTITNTIAASGSCPAATATFTITINPVPVVSVNSAIICNGQTATLTASGATSYTWSAGATSTGVNTATASPAATTSYTVTGTSGGCTATAIAVVTVNPCNVPVANFSGNPTVFCTTPACVNFTDLSTNSPTSWSWSFPGSTTPTSTAQNPTNICYTANGSYTVILIASNTNGSDTLVQTNYITVGAPVSVSISGNTTIDACESTTLTASPGDGTYVWGPYVHIDCSDCVAATVNPSSTQDYYVTYTSPGGCTASDTITVNVENIFTYFMPTAFSPNGDGINDVLYVKGRGIDFINLKIYDRVGELVFSSTSLDHGWDGRLHGVPMNDNEFVYKLEVTFCNGDVKKEHGGLTLAK